MSDWIKSPADTMIYRREKISGVRIYKHIYKNYDKAYKVEVLADGDWRSYYEGSVFSTNDEEYIAEERAKAWGIYRKLCAELE